ncbi:MAG: pyrroline-5-carboxylate reductase [Dehalococcoidales bacterium]|nr:pyrroline-5-carboxylate reductase [Dehalococcoidales bacterium]
MRIVFIGGGNMGAAMLVAILDREIAKPADITVSDLEESRRQYLKQEYAVSVTSNNRRAVKNGDVIILAIKPQQLAEVMTELSGQLKGSQLALSIIAGARINTLRSGLNHRRLVRVMPNTPAQIGEGMSVWTATDEVTERQKGWARAILGAMGSEIYVDDEDYIDMATAVSGSGPGYVFRFAEAMIDAAIALGFSEDIARELVSQTMLGSVHFMQQSGKPAAELRRMVTSPGGTTAEALAQFDRGQFTEVVKQAVRAAYHRARELGN